LPLLLFTTLSTAILAQNYSITDLGTLGGDQSQAYAISVNGDVVGYYRSKGSQFHAFLWTRKNGMKDLTPTITGERAFAYAVNNSDEVALYISNTNSENAADLKADGSIIDLGPFITPEGINNSGMIVGGNHADHAFVWTQTGGMQDLGTLTGGVSLAFAINDSGQVVGYSSASGEPSHAFLWTSETGMLDLGTLEAGAGATAISPSGLVAGFYFTSVGDSYDSKPLLWTRSNGLQKIDPLSGSSSSDIKGINDAGQVVGCASFPFGPLTAFMWSPVTGSKDLLSLVTNNKNFSSLECAYAINASGQIVGAGIATSGRYHAFLLTPIKR
jgi:probable HAF family extracellular repeat protein